MTVTARFEVSELMRIFGYEKASACLCRIYPIAQRVARDNRIPLAAVMGLLRLWSGWTGDVFLMQDWEICIELNRLWQMPGCDGKPSEYVRQRDAVEVVLENAAEGHDFVHDDSGLWRPRECMECKHGFVVVENQDRLPVGPGIVRVSIDTELRRDADVWINPFWSVDMIRDTCEHVVTSIDLACGCAPDAKAGEEDNNVTIS